jgi:glycosyltransferase involved in cell wall biosynthesis
MTAFSETDDQRVTACVPAYRSGAFIQRTLDSLAAQTYASLDVVVSDDCSDDDTGARCAAMASRDSRFKVVRQTQRLGWVGNVNFLLAQVDSPFVFIMPHDDWLEPTYVERLVAGLIASPGAVLAYADSEEWRLNQGDSITCFPASPLGDTPQRRGARFIRFEYGCWLPYRGLIRTAVLKRVGGLRRHRRGEVYADIDWLLALALEGAFVRQPEVLYHKEYQQTSLTYQWILDHRAMLAALWACMGRVSESRVGVGAKAMLVATIFERCSRVLAKMLLEKIKLRRPASDWRL